MQSMIHQKGGIPSLKNSLGAEWRPIQSDSLWGLGCFCWNETPLGDPLPFFLAEESNQSVYTLSSWRVLEDTPQRASLLFEGVCGKLGIRVTAVMTADAPAVTFTYEIDPIHPVYHRVYAPIPFYAPKAVFLKYPYEDTLYADSERWSVETDISRMPVSFGCEQLDGRDHFLCVGYHLDDPFDQGRFELDPKGAPDAPFRIYSPFKGMARHLDLQCITELELLHVDLEKERRDSIRTFRFIVSMGQTQYDCLKGYIDCNGYDKKPHIQYGVEEAKEQLYSLYKNAPGYIPGKGYTQLIRTDTGRCDSTVPHGWYSKDICPGPLCQLGYELYHYWRRLPGEVWARERAFEMADFLVASQLPNGLFTNVNSDTAKLFSSSAGLLSAPLAKYIYNIGDMCLGAYHLYMLYDEVKAHEGVDHAEWKEAAQRTIRTVMASVGKDGSLGRNYNAMGEYDVQCAAVSEALMAMNYMYQDTGDEEIRRCRDLVEEHVYRRYVRLNDFADNCMDGGAWVGGGTPPKDNDTMGLMGFVCYCMQRHQQTGEARYLQMAKDAFIYQFVCVIPIEIPGFSHRTRGLIREQDFYSAFDLPMRVNDYLDCLPYLSKVTGDPLFAQFFAIILQTEMDYQEKFHPYRGIHIGLQNDYDGRTPIDSIAERNSVYIIRFAALFLKAVNGPLSYQYVGSADWGVGRDYNLPFAASLGEHMPYILSCTGMIRNYTWDVETGTIHIWGFDRENETITVELQWNGCAASPEASLIRTAEGEVCAASCLGDNGVLTIRSSNADAPSKMIDIVLR